MYGASLGLEMENVLVTSTCHELFREDDLSIDAGHDLGSNHLTLAASIPFHGRGPAPSGLRGVSVSVA